MMVASPLRIAFSGAPLPAGCPGALPSTPERSGTRGRSSATVLEDTLSGLMSAAQDGDGQALRTLLRACMPVIAGVVRSKGIRGEVVDDVVQETLLTVHRARATYDPARPFLPWLRAIAQRRAIDALRREGRRPQETYDPVRYEAHADDGPAPSHELEARERDARLARAVAALPEGQRQAVEELSLAERSLAEAAARTGRSKVALKVNLHRALKSLRAALGESRRDGDV